jgi:hypothetical protein
MGKLFPEIDERNAEWIRSQRVFFVATAPLAGDGHVNLSPKGLESFAILGPREVAYVDLVGSGIETASHLRENGRIVFMFCAFEGPPRILRLHGRGEVVEPGDAAWEALASRLPSPPQARAIVRARVERIADSCGYGVPLYAFEGQRTQLAAWAERKGEAGLRAYVEEHGARSIDGLPGLRARRLAPTGAP